MTTSACACIVRITIVWVLVGADGTWDTRASVHAVHVLDCGRAAGTKASGRGRGRAWAGAGDGVSAPIGASCEPGHVTGEISGHAQTIAKVQCLSFPMFVFSRTISGILLKLHY